MKKVFFVVLIILVFIMGDKAQGFLIKTAPMTTETPVLSVTSNQWDVSSAAGMTTFRVSNTGSGTIAAARTENAGTSLKRGEIWVKATGTTGSPNDMTPRQAGSPVLRVNPLARIVSARLGTTTFSISNTGGGTMSWSAAVIEGGDWLSIQLGGSGTNGGTITAFYKDYPETTFRRGTIRVTASGAAGSPRDVTVTQEMTAGGTTGAASGTRTDPYPPVLSVTPVRRDVSSARGETTFSVSNTGGGTIDWTASADSKGSQWLKINSGASGTNTGTITVAYAGNRDRTARSGSIRIEERVQGTTTGPAMQRGKIKVVNVYQMGYVPAK